jgi:phosphate/sulfate permease
VGLAEGRKGAVKWTQLLKMFAGWVFTLLVGMAISASLFAWVSMGLVGVSEVVVLELPVSW